MKIMSQEKDHMNDKVFQELSKLKPISIKIDRKRDYRMFFEHMATSCCPYSISIIGIEPGYSERFFRRLKFNDGN